jgi:hypothetical protein
MRTYVAFTGFLFALLVAAHVWRVFLEPHLLHDLPFWMITVLAATLSVWAWLALRRTSRS